ncbi:hypothetical protein AG1IA_07824 [Rhizoctonia solani AG-1 IA]|uniref:Uncharacterized protein n=1 Tax=Thanatephorus cucumeris (strain AG1-IA) TaxID=983506 RepID=L8WP86_THACA|nr:hypothetical protein AG1IA_07824 [Rhizoctonia solani AG-1 IA]
MSWFGDDSNQVRVVLAQAYEQVTQRPHEASWSHELIGYWRRSLRGGKSIREPCCEQRSSRRPRNREGAPYWKVRDSWVPLLIARLRLGGSMPLIGRVLSAMDQAEEALAQQVNQTPGLKSPDKSRGKHYIRTPYASRVLLYTTRMRPHRTENVLKVVVFLSHTTFQDFVTP